MEQNNIARYKELNSGEWHEIVEWGAETGSLKDWQSGIASTLSGVCCRRVVQIAVSETGQARMCHD